MVPVPVVPVPVVPVVPERVVIVDVIAMIQCGECSTMRQERE